MPATKAVTLETTRSAEELFKSLLVVVQNGGYETVGLSNEQHEVLFRSGKTAMSWGHHYVASVVEVDGGSIFQLTTAGVPGAPTSLMDGRKNTKAGQKVVQALDDELGKPGTPAPAPSASFATLADGSTVPWAGGEYPGA